MAFLNDVLDCTLQINGTISRCNLFLVHSTWACQVSPELFWTQNTHRHPLCPAESGVSPGEQDRLCHPWCRTPEEPGGGVCGWLRERNMLPKVTEASGQNLQPHSRLSARSLREQAVLHDSTYPSLSPCCHQRESRRQEREKAKGRGVEDSKRGGLSWCDRAWTRHGDRHTWERKRESKQALIERQEIDVEEVKGIAQAKIKFCHYVFIVMSFQSSITVYFPEAKSFQFSFFCV